MSSSFSSDRPSVSRHRSMRRDKKEYLARSSRRKSRIHLNYVDEIRVVDNETKECDSEFLKGTRNRIELRYG